VKRKCQRCGAKEGVREAAMAWDKRRSDARRATSARHDHDHDGVAADIALIALISPSINRSC
jgi:hypothetical protein